jgi:hypothetical protein
MHVPPTHVLLMHVPSPQHGRLGIPQPGLEHVPASHVSDPLHDPPLQHGSPLSPHEHTPPTHVDPAAHAPPKQHACATPPHVPHVPLTVQDKPLLHTFDAQHDCPEPPHAVQLAPVQMLLGMHGARGGPQQGWLVEPHWHVVPTQTPPVGHDDPQHASPTSPHARHVPPVSHALPIEHVDPEQHGCVAPPHGTHCDDPLHRRLAPPGHVPPRQHVCMLPPHDDAQREFTSQTSPALHVPDPQHGSPLAPHMLVVTHIPGVPVHVNPDTHAPPAQHLCPDPPHETHLIIDASHAVIDVVHGVAPEQHGAPRPPQLWHIALAPLPTHTEPALHDDPEQHG